MAEPFLSEIRIFSFNFPPKGWALCNGQLMPINQNQALFALLGTTYGGDGRTTFALPNLQGRTPMHMGNGHTLGEKAGEEAHTLTTQELPTHTHLLRANGQNGTKAGPANSVLAAAPVYHAASNLTPLNPTSVSNVGGGQPHLNMQPYLALNFCIALLGIFPSRN